MGLSALACVLLACGDEDDPAPQTTPTGSVQVLDASVRELPGDGAEPTPPTDIDARQRPRVGRDGLGETVNRYLNDGGVGSPSSTDSGTTTGDPSDAGTD